MVRLILFLVRRKLGLKNHEYFRFSNQKTNNLYYIDDRAVWKIQPRHTSYGTVIHDVKLSNVSINWLLGDRCKIEKVEE